MATDSTNLPQGETTLDAGMDMTASDLDLTTVQEVANEPQKFVDLPKGNTVVLLPVQPGQTVQLPTDSANGVLAKIGPEGNLALVVDGRTIILQGFLKANDQSPIKIVTNDGDDVNVADLIAATDPSLDIQTAAGPASGDQGDTEGSGIYVPFAAGPGLGGIGAEGILDPTALQYRLIDDEYKEFVLDEEGNVRFEVTFDILGGIVNEDDLRGDVFQEPELPQAAAALTLGGKGYGYNNGMNGEGNDPFDSKDNDQGGATGPDDGYPDPDREPDFTVATIKATFPGGAPGTLTLDLLGLPTDLKSHGELVTFVLIPGLGAGDEIVGFIDDGDGTYEAGERLVVTVKADTNLSPTGEFNVTFTLHDQIDHDAPDQNPPGGDGKADLLGANEQIFGLPVHFTLSGGGASADSTLPLGVEDDIPFFGKVVLSCEGIDIVCTDPEITHDETRDVQWWDSDDVNIHNFWVQCLGKQLACSIIEGGYELPEKCETEGTLKGAAKTQVHVSFGADGPAVFICDSADKTARNSIFGELEDRAQGDEDGENEHPFELFMVKSGTPVDSKANPLQEGSLTITEQPTNTTVYWNDANPELPVFIDQIDAHTIVGYVNAPGCEEGTDKVAVFTLYIDDNGCLSFYQYHQLNHDQDGKSYADHDDSLFITDPNGNPLIYIRATDYDGDHAIQPVGLEIQDDGPRCCGIDWGCDYDSVHGVGVIDEEALRHGIWGGPGDDRGGKHTDGKILVDFGVDRPGHMEIQELCVRDCTGKTVLKICIDENGCLNVVENCLKAIDDRALSFEKCGPDSDGKVTWTAFIADCPGEKVFSFTLDTSGACIGEFDFCLFKPLEHPLTSGPELLPALFEHNGGQTSYEDNFKFDFKVRSYDSDGDYTDCNVKVNVDDDSPDPCKVEISFCDEDNKLVHDETGGVQIGGKWFPWDHDPDASWQPEDDTWYVKDFGKFEKEQHCLDPIGYAKTELKVDLSGGGYDPKAAFGADGPGCVSPVSIVTDCGKPFCGEKTNLNDTKTGCAIFLFTEVVCGETYVVGRVGGEGGEVSFALHVSDCGDLELAQYRAIQHPDGCDSDESLKLLDCEGNALIHLQVAVTDADGDTVYARQAVDGCHGNPSIVFQDDGPTFCGIDWGRCEYDAVRGVGVIDEEALRGGIPGGPGDDAGGKHADGKLNFKFGTDGPGCVEITELKVKDNSGKTVLEICAGPGGELFIKENCLQAIDGKALDFEKCEGPGGVVTWTAFIAGCPGEKVFTFTLDTKGHNVGEFDFCLYKPLEHPDNNGYPYDNYKDDGKGSFEDNFKFDFTVRATDGDGDKVDANVCISVDDDSPDACKVDISLCDWNNKLVHDETEGVQNGGFFIPGDGDKQPSYQDEDDDCEQPKDYEKFEEKLDLCAIGYAKTEIKVDLSGGNPYKPNAAFGADGPGSVDVALVANNGKPFCGEKTNLHDTKTGEPIFLYTIEECGESFVVGRICGEDGPIVFALHVSDCGDLELAQYRAIQHPDGCDPDESITLLDCNGKDGIINIKVTVTDADGDAVCVTKPLDGCHGNPSIVFQDDGPCVEKCPEGKVVLAMDETVDPFPLWARDQNTPEPDGPQDGPTPENDAILHAFDLIKAALGGLPVPSLPIGAAADNVANLFKVDFGTDGGCVVCYDLTILCGDGKTDLRDTETGTCITLVDCGNGVVKGIDGCDNVVFAIWLDHDSGDIVSAQYRAIDHGGEEGKPGAHDEIAWLGEHVLGVTATAYDKDGDKDSKTVDIGCGISFEDDGPKADLDLKHNAKIVLDESDGTPNQYDDKNANDENDSADPTDIAYAKVAGNQLFVDNSDFGSDGFGSRVYSLETVDGTNSGLVDAASNAAILLYKVDDNTVEGRIGGIAGAVAFRIDTDPTSGEVTISQFFAVEHNNAGDSSGTHDESGSSSEIMDPNKLFLKVTITDGDCDGDSDKVDLGKIIKFEDDGPIARNDTDTVSEGVIQPATGNVIVPGDGGLGQVDENGEDGVADDPGTDGLQSIAWQGSVGNTVAGKYGTLTIDANGNYKYDLNEADEDLKTLDTGESDYEVFTYTITDKDGDTDTATLKIKVNGLNDTNKPNFEDENALVDEDGLPNGILNDPLAPTDDPAPGDDVGGHQELDLPDPASEAIFRDSLNINWDQDVGTIVFSVTDADLATIHPLNGAVLTTANVSGNGSGDLGIWDGVPGESSLIMTVKVIDATTSVYEVQLLQPIQHTDPASEDNKSLPVKVTATNDGGTSEHTLTIGIDDDRPVATDDEIDATPGSDGSADVVFIVDVSGSMTNGGGSIVVPDVPDFSDDRLGLARFSMRELLENHPEILNVQFVKFDNNVSSSVWMTRADALTYINNDANFVGGGTTNYDIALQEAMDVYDDSPRPAGAAEQTLVYFLSDGQPNTPDDDEGITDNGTAPNVSVGEWETFVTTPANNITNVFAIGLGSAVVSQLEPISYPNDDVNPNNGDEDRVIIIPDSNITALTQTLDDLLGSVVTPTTGDVTDNDDFGADGAGDPKLVSVKYGPTTYNFIGGVTEHIIDLGAGKGTLKIEDDGDYTYTPPETDGADGDPFFVEYTIRDGDGDTVTGKINIDLTVPPTTDNVLASGDEDNTTGIAVVLTGDDNDGTVASFRITSLPANGTLFADALLTTPLAVGDLVPAASNTVYFVPNANYSGSTAFNYAAVDNDGVQDPSPATADITVNPVNDAPDANITAPSYSATEQTPLALHGTGLSISDIDAGSGDVTVTLSVGFGILSVVAGNSGVGIGGNNSSSVTLTGTVAEINSLLNDSSTGTINYTASDAPPANTQLTLHVNDEGNTGGGDLTDSAVVTINITDAPEPPQGVNDRIYTNIGGDVTVKDSWLLKNDKDTDTAHASLIIASAAAAAGQSGFFDEQPDHSGTNVTFNIDQGNGKGQVDDGESTSFIYVVKDPVLEGSANVAVHYDTTGSVNGSSEDDILIGNDVGLQGAGGNDQIAGTGTTDLLDYSEINTNWSLTLGAGGAGTASINGDDTYEGIDGIIGGTGNNQLTGNADANILNGGDGNDTLTGAGGADSLNGGNGNDVLVVSDADGTLNDFGAANGGSGQDTLKFGDGASDRNFDLSGTTNELGNIDSIETIDMTDGFDDDVLQVDGTRVNALGSASENSNITVNVVDVLPGVSAAFANDQIDLFVLGDNNDDVDVSESWTNLGAANIGGVNYTLYGIDFSGDDDAVMAVKTGVTLV